MHTFQSWLISFVLELTMKLRLGSFANYEMYLAIGLFIVLLGSRQDCEAAGTVVRSIYVSKKAGGGGDNFKSIQEAIDAVPFGNDRWIRIHVAAGVYKEKVTIPSNKSFIVLEGEGSQETSIEWNDHAGRGSGTASTPTFASFTTDFMACDITFKNTYDGGDTTVPALAALVAGDRSSFYRCGFISVQDTLSDLLGRHYYKNCYIEGSIDFIFGQGQSIFQGCEIVTVKTPIYPGYITAQGRSSEEETSGFVFKGGTVQGVTPAFLGRAWRRYARVIFYETAMSSIVVRQGWDAWKYKGQESTLMMVETNCTGSGANKTARVPWSKALSGKELDKFVDLSYISGDGWLAAQPR